MSSTPHSVSVLEHNKQLVIRWFEEVWNQGRRETIFELFSPNAVLHDGANHFHGPEEFIRFHDALRAQFSDFRITPVVALAEGDLACVHWSASFRHTATSKSLQISGTSIVRIENGQFKEAWQNWDAAGLSAQLAA
jgi:predicted SnoaL-like aldol condensation-catalyzing enzyme